MYKTLTALAVIASLCLESPVNAQQSNCPPGIESGAMNHVWLLQRSSPEKQREERFYPMLPRDGMSLDAVILCIKEGVEQNTNGEYSLDRYNDNIWLYVVRKVK